MRSVLSALASLLVIESLGICPAIGATKKNYWHDLPQQLSII